MKFTVNMFQFPLPAPRGGKHSNNPILSEDQRVPQQRPTRLAMKKTNALEPDYTAGETALHESWLKLSRFTTE